MKKNRVNKSMTEMTKSYEKLFSEWIAVNWTRHKDSTRANYLMKYRKHISSTFGDKKCSEISFRNINEFISQKISDGLSVNYVIDILVLMKSVFRYAERCYCHENPFNKVVMPKKQLKHKELLNTEERIRLEAFLFDHLSIKTIGMLLSLKMSMRIGEICALKWADIDLENKLIYIRHTVQRIKCDKDRSKTKVIIGEPKSVKSVRAVPIPPKMLEALKMLKNDDDCYVVSGKKAFIEPRTMQYRFKKVLKDANISNINFHALRHIFATCAVDRGFEIKALSEIMGHSSVNITLKMYVHPDIEIKRKYMNLMDVA